MHAGAFRAAAAAWLLAAAAPARAQIGLTVPDSASRYGAASNPACIDTISQASLSYAIVYQHLHLSVVDPGLESQASLLSQHVAARIRATLADSDSVSRSDSLIDWHSLDGPVPVRIVIRRDAPGAWYTDSADDAAAARLRAVYVRAFASLSPGDLQFIWPPSRTADSLVLRFSVDAIPGRSVPSAFDDAVPIVAMKAPPEMAPHPLGQTFPEYPRTEQEARIAGDVLLEGDLDSTGRIEPATLHEIEPVELTKGQGSRANHQEFVRAARTAVLATHYAPARIGGCPVRLTVDLPFRFRPPPG